METQLLILNYKLTEIRNLFLNKTMYDIGEISKEELIDRNDEVIKTTFDNTLSVLQGQLDVLQPKSRSYTDSFTHSPNLFER